MPEKGWKTLQVKQEYEQRLRDIYERRKHELLDRNIRTFNGFVQALIWRVIESDEQLSRKGPYLEYIPTENPEAIFIKDNKTGRIVEVTMKNGVFYCSVDQRGDCVHVGFAWAIPEVYREMNLRGRRMPEIR
ncbi:MAG: hypothetical protein HYU39_04810 [Thaumarchaeota archaeon]|nr:hypothetical protein [Nitrososphaerota archaeon]